MLRSGDASVGGRRRGRAAPAASIERCCATPTVRAGAQAVLPDTPRSPDRRELPALDDLVDDPVLLGLGGRQDLVALDVEADLLGGLAAVLGQGGLQQLAH